MQDDAYNQKEKRQYVVAKLSTMSERSDSLSNKEPFYWKEVYREIYAPPFHYIAFLKYKMQEIHYNN